MIDFAPGPRGCFVRVVVNGNTRRETVERIVEEVGRGEEGIDENE